MLRKALKDAESYAQKHNFDYVLNIFKKGELLGGAEASVRDANWARFEKKPGVYILSTDGEVVYVGKSNVDTGNRLWSHFNTDEKLEKMTDDSQVAVLTFSKEDNALTSALETYLIEKYKPILNKTNH